MFTVIFLALLFWVLAYHGVSLVGWTAAIGSVLLAHTLFSWSENSDALIALWAGYAAVAVILNVPAIRRVLISDFVLRGFKKVLPAMSQTERDALEAGTVWWDGQLFSGNPNWRELLDYKPAKLTPEEQAFIDGPVEDLCAMLNDFEINQELNDLPPEAWEFIKKNRFFGMIVAKEYGGLGFSAYAHSCVVMKIASRSIAAAVTVMVPNSLGPAELLHRYGTQKQKDYYLPRLAVGEEVPCFALTSPEAGSDASSIPDFGIICRATFNGEKDVLGIRVTWNKRYITLGPVATVLGLAFQTRDPNHLLGDKVDLGITCALIPTEHRGVKIGRRHFPLNVGFQNGPNHGDDVFIPMDFVIGGQARIGQGWRMLMECLAAGRSISLPALSVGGAKFASRAVGAYARVRKQFRTPIGYFEGVEEPLARIGAYAYMTDAARSLTASALDQGQSPSVISAILKFNLTERMRKAINDAMDIQGGAGICMGPHNLFGKIYQAIPISITVEGANILTRSLIIYGQGAIRCHPFVLKEMEAAMSNDKKAASAQFDAAFTGHIGFNLRNAARAFYYGLTDATTVATPVKGPVEHYYQHLTRMSASFAFLSDICMLVFGGDLKRKEKISARLGDVLGLMYLASCTLKRYEDEGRQEADLPLVEWACEDLLYQMQEALLAVTHNLPSGLFGFLLRRMLFPWGPTLTVPSDKAGHKVARLLLALSPTRDRLTEGVFVPRGEYEQMGRLELALELVEAADGLEKIAYKAKKNGDLTGYTPEELIEAAYEKGLIDTKQVELYRRYNSLRKEIIQVDDFDPNAFELKKRKSARLVALKKGKSDGSDTNKPVRQSGLHR